MLKLRTTGAHPILPTCPHKWVLQYTTCTSTTNPTNPMAEYLVTTLGFSKKEALATSSQVARLNPTENPDFVLNFFTTFGFTKTQMRKIVSTTPRILAWSVDKVLKPKIQAFEEFGLSGSDLTRVISGYPYIFSRGLTAYINPTLGVLKEVFGDNNDDVFLKKAMMRSCWMLAPSIHKELPLVMSLLRSYGLSVDQIRLLVLRKPRYFALDSKWLQGVLVKVEEEFGIPRDSPMFIHGICALSSLSEETLERKVELFKSFGFDDADVLTVAKKNPFALAISEAKLRKSLEFFMKEVGYNPAEIASRSYLLNFSLKTRVFPRYEVYEFVRKKGLMKVNCAFASCLLMTESQFVKKFVQPLKDTFPEIYDTYMKRTHAPSKSVEVDH